jgi:transcriptional regulator with XRE-family HTH domain
MKRAADGVTKIQVYSDESGTSQPTLDVIKKLAVTLSVTTDKLIFEAGERKPDNSLLLLLEGIGGLDADEKRIIKELVEGILLKHQAKPLIRSSRPARRQAAKEERQRDDRTSKPPHHTGHAAGVTGLF